MTAVEGAVYVYGILRTAEERSLSVTGIDGSDVHTIDHAGLSALVSDLRTDTLSAARGVRAHWRVLDQASADTTVLPVRFGTVLESEQAVRQRLLEPNAPRFEGLLRALAGRVEVNLKGTYDEQRLLRDIVAGSPVVAAARERVRRLPDAAAYYEQIRLGELIAGEVARRRDQDTALALERLQPHAVDHRVTPVTDPDAAFKLAFLLERKGIDAFSEAVGGVITELGDRVSVRYVGPLVPYSFVDADLTGGGDTWA